MSSNPVQYVGTWYFREGIIDHTKVVDLAVRVLTPKKDEYDVLVGTGVSGSLLLTTLAYLLQVRFVVIRKGKSGHSNALIEGQLMAGDRCLFIDDFISTGETKRTLIRVLRSEAKKNNISPLPHYTAQYMYIASNPSNGYKLLNPRGGLKK